MCRAAHANLPQIVSLTGQSRYRLHTVLPEFRGYKHKEDPLGKFDSKFLANLAACRETPETFNFDALSLAECRDLAKYALVPYGAARKTEVVTVVRRLFLVLKSEFGGTMPSVVDGPPLSAENADVGCVALCCRYC